MNIPYLRYAVAVANAGSVRKAAEKLFIAQPNLSRAIKELEKEVGIVIFERKANGITLTPDGERFIELGKKIIRQIDELETEFSTDRQNKSVFSASVPRASYISYAFARFSNALKYEERSDLYYKETNALRAITNVLEKDYNLGIIRYPSRYDKYFKETLDEKNVVYELIAEFKYVLLTAKNSKLAEKETVTYDDLTDMIEIAHADPYVPSVALSEIRREELPNNIKRRIFVFERASQFDILSANPETFMWVSPVPDEMLEKHGLVLKTCEDNEKLYRDMLIYKKGYKLSRLDKAFINELCKSKRRFIGSADDFE